MKKKQHKPAGSIWRVSDQFFRIARPMGWYADCEPSYEWELWSSTHKRWLYFNTDMLGPYLRESSKLEALVCGVTRFDEATY